jgi:hypothetical protein
MTAGRCIVLWVILAIAALCSPASGEPYIEQGRAEITPWSGYWWPIRQGGLTAPLSKYDLATGQRAVAWEKAHRPSDANVPEWFGFCHAWAASSIMEPEPKQFCTCRGRNGRSADLGVGDQKGMLAACHTDDVANSYGHRCGDGEGPEDPQDIAPDLLWRILKLYVGSQKIPMVIDIEPGPEVWNFPVYAYEIRSDGTGDGQQDATLTLWMSDDGVPPDYVGSQARRTTYTFACTMRGGAVVMGTGRWTGRSEKDHPDFAWYPYIARADNPEVHYTAVRELVGQGPGAPPSVSPPLPEPPSPDPSQPTVRPEPPVRPEVVSPAQGLPGPNDLAERPVLTPVELAALVANRTSAFGFDVTVDRFDGGIYRAGDPITVHVRSTEAGYLYLFYLDNQGKLLLLYPHGGQPMRIAADTPTDIPGPKARFAFRAGSTPGTHRIKAVVTSRPVLFSGLVAAPQQQAQVQQHRQQEHVQQQRPVQQQSPSPRHPRQQPGRSRDAVVEQSFRWPPSQRQQVQAILGPYVGQNAQQRVEGIDPRQVLGRFAQDEVLFIVEPSAASGKTGQSPAQDGVPLPSQDKSL